MIFIRIYTTDIKFINAKLGFLVHTCVNFISYSVEWSLLLPFCVEGKNNKQEIVSTKFAFPRVYIHGKMIGSEEVAPAS